MLRKKGLFLLAVLLLVFVFAVPVFAVETALPVSGDAAVQGEDGITHNQFAKMVTPQKFSVLGANNLAEIYVWGNEIVHFRDDFNVNDKNDYNGVTGIDIRNVSDLYGASIDIKFDPGLIQVVNVETDDFFAESHSIWDNEEGTITILLSQTGDKEAFYGGKQLCRIAWQSDSPGDLNWQVTSNREAFIGDNNICVQLVNSELLNPPDSRNVIPYDDFGTKQKILDPVDVALAGYLYAEFDYGYNPANGVTVKVMDGEQVVYTTQTNSGFFTVQRDQIANINYEKDYTVRCEGEGYVDWITSVNLDPNNIVEIWGDMKWPVSWHDKYDFDNNDIIDIYDIVYVSKHMYDTDRYNLAFDFNVDGKIDYADFRDIAKRYNMKNPNQ